MATPPSPRCKWERATGSIMLEVARTKSGKEEVLGICNEGNLLISPSETGVGGEVIVNNQQLYIYGALQAQKDPKGTIHVYVATDMSHTDPSFQFEYYTFTGNPDSSEKPPTHVLFESKLYPGNFITWDSSGTIVKCEFHEKNSHGLPDINIPDGCQVTRLSPRDERYVWVIPVDSREIPQFALRTYGRSYFLAFAKSGRALLVPGDQINSEVTIFRLRSL